MGQNWDAILLAAGSGTRMKSKTPKVLQKVAGTPMLQRIIKQLHGAGCKTVHVVVTEALHQLLKPMQSEFGDVEFHIQHKPLGTGDAVLSVPAEVLSSQIFICNGDHPLMNQVDVVDLQNIHQKSSADVSVAILEMDQPGSFGRVIKDGDQIEKIIEAKEASPEQLSIKDINTGLYLGKTEVIYGALAELQNLDRTTEFYLTDIVEAVRKKSGVVKWINTTEDMAFGVNDSESLYLSNQKAYLQNNQKLLSEGVKFIDIHSSYIDDDVTVEPDTLIYPNVFLKGKTHIAEACVIEAGVHIFSSQIGPQTYLKAGSYIESTVIRGECSVGPYARLREGTLIEKSVKIGNFVESKKTHFKEGVKAGHQCYLGDTEIGEGTNIGAGTITCNFAVDGKKYKTQIGKNVFVGSDSQIVPPVSIGDSAVIAAGATVTKDVEAGSLYVTRAKAIVKKNYKG